MMMIKKLNEELVEIQRKLTEFIHYRECSKTAKEHNLEVEEFGSMFASNDFHTDLFVFWDGLINGKPNHKNLKEKIKFKIVRLMFRW